MLGNRLELKKAAGGEGEVNAVTLAQVSSGQIEFDARTDARIGLNSALGSPSALE